MSKDSNDNIKMIKRMNNWKRKRHGKVGVEISQTEVTNAVKSFLANGGKITPNDNSEFVPPNIQGEADRYLLGV